MLKKIAVFGFILLIIGSAVLYRVIVETKKQKNLSVRYELKYGSEADRYIEQYNQWLRQPPQTRSESPFDQELITRANTPSEVISAQYGRRIADMDRLIAGEMNSYPFADVLYGPDWQAEVEKFRRQRETRELILTGSIVCLSVGSAVLVLALLTSTGGFLFKTVTRVKAGIKRWAYRRNGQSTAAPVQNEALNMQNPSMGDECELPAVPPDVDKQQASDRGGDVSWTPAYISASQTALVDRSRFYSDRHSDDYKKQIAAVAIAPAIRKKRALQNNASKHPRTHYCPEGSERDLDPDVRKLSDSLNAQAQTLEQQMQEFRKMAQTVQQTTIEQSMPLSGALNDLSEQVAAIREYAASQQQRVEKLQDGYDWNIIRTFCLRVIRCIDNLDARIDRLAPQSPAIDPLNEIRDELIFALESSGVEQYHPKLDSDYRGQEKFAEAVREKQSPPNPDHIGKIAKILRPGYQYFIDDDNVKIVRAAQVQLYG